MIYEQGREIEQIVHKISFDGEGVKFFLKKQRQIHEYTYLVPWGTRGKPSEPTGL